jgi:uncharacterized protein (UPF0332 family)/predicted nucleotidyltransferase
MTMFESAATEAPPLISPWKAVYILRRQLREGWGDGFKGMIVFGSLARGEWTEESDVDVMVLLDDSMDAKAESRRIWDIAFEIYRQYGIEVQPVVVTERQYQTGSAPLYFNVRREGWFVTPENQPEVVEKLLEQAANTLSEAQLLLENELFDGATSRGYYAMFNAAQASLASLGIYRSRHSGVIAAFGYQFVHMGQFPAELHASFAEGFEPRVSADYGPDSVDSSVAREMVSNAGRFLEAVTDQLN